MRTQIWNNGGGTQSAAVAALIVTGKLPKPDLAVIADTGREKSATWDYLCIHCGFDGAEWSHWKRNTYEGRADTEAKAPLCIERRVLVTANVGVEPPYSVGSNE